MGTPARFMASESVKSDQPTIKATSLYASGYDQTLIPKRRFSVCWVGLPAYSEIS
jgi:hypothetical protein